MEERLSTAELAIVKLSEGQSTAFILNDQIATSVEKIAMSLDQLNKFQTETETHRQHDMEFKTEINNKIDHLMDRREKDLNAIFKEIRKENKELVLIRENQIMLKKDIEVLTVDFTTHVETGDTRREANRKIAWTTFGLFFVTITGAFLVWWLNDPLTPTILTP